MRAPSFGLLSLSIQFPPHPSSSIAVQREQASELKCLSVQIFGSPIYFAIYGCALN